MALDKDFQTGVIHRLPQTIFVESTKNERMIEMKVVFDGKGLLKACYAILLFLGLCFIFAMLQTNQLYPEYKNHWVWYVVFSAWVAFFLFMLVKKG